MLSDGDCLSLAEQCLARIAQQCGEDLVLMPSLPGGTSTLVYPYQTAHYLETGDSIHALAGNGPILVSKLTGAVEIAGTALPTESCILEFEARAGKAG